MVLPLHVIQHLFVDGPWKAIVIDVAAIDFSDRLIIPEMGTAIWINTAILDPFSFVLITGKPHAPDRHRLLGQAAGYVRQLDARSSAVVFPVIDKLAWARNATSGFAG